MIDPHKWLFAPFDCAALLYRRPGVARAAHTQHAAYLDVLHAEPAPELEPERLRLPPHPPRPRPARSGSRSPPTAPTPTATPIEASFAVTARGAELIRDGSTTSSW